MRPRSVVVSRRRTPEQSAEPVSEYLPTIARSLAAVAAGIIVIGAGAAGAGATLLRFFPHSFNEDGAIESQPLLLLLLAYTVVFVVLGGYVTGKIAGRFEMRHGFALSIIVLLCSGVSAAVFSDRAPAWWHFSLLGCVVPAIMLGGYARSEHRRRSRRRSPRSPRA